MRARTDQAVDRFRRLKGSLVGAVAAGLVLLGVAEAFALPVGMRLKVEDITTSTPFGVLITDGGAGDTDSTANGVISYVGSIGGFSLNITTGLSKPTVPTAPGIFAQLYLESLNVQSVGPGKLRVTLEDDGYTNGIGLTGLKFQSSASGTLTGSIALSAQTWFDATNATPTLGADVGPPPGTLSPTGPIPGTATPGLGTGLAFSSSGGTASGAANGQVAFFASSSYSLFTQLTLDFTTAGDSDFTASSIVVPEPATLTLLGVGLVGMLLGVRRQRN